MCFTCKSLCCGYVSLETGSYATGIYKILVDSSLLYLVFSLFFYTPQFAGPIAISAFVTCVFLIVFNMLLVFGIVYRKRAILGLWLYIQIIILMMCTFVLLYFVLVGTNFKQGVIKELEHIFTTTTGIISISILSLSTLSGYFLWNLIYALFEKMRDGNRPHATNTEFHQTYQQQTLPQRRISYLRSPSLPTYDNVMCSESSKNLETPPPKFDQVAFHFQS